MSRLFSLPGIALLLAVLAVVGSFVHPYFTATAAVHVAQQNSYGGTVRNEEELIVPNLEAWVDQARAAQYNVDVKVTAHGWERHGAEATEAIRCLTNNGTTTVLSEKNSRNLHLICIDPNTGNAYVAIIERIRKYSDSMQNATSRLITAFKLTNVTVEQYVTWETTVKSIVVRVAFKAGELFFTP